MWSSFLNGTGSNEFSKISHNNDLFNKLVIPACFQQCAKTDVDIVFLNEMECSYKCMITYKQAYRMIQDMDSQ